MNGEPGGAVDDDLVGDVGFAAVNEDRMRRGAAAPGGALEFDSVRREEKDARGGDEERVGALAGAAVVAGFDGEAEGAGLTGSAAEPAGVVEREARGKRAFGDSKPDVIRCTAGAAGGEDLEFVRLRENRGGKRFGEQREVLRVERDRKQEKPPHRFPYRRGRDVP
jgi:hypothetical protein